MTDNQRGSQAFLEDAFMRSALAKGYRVSDRSDVDRVFQEIRFQQSGLTTSDAAKLGRMLNCQAVLIVQIAGANVESQSRGIINGAYQTSYTAWCDMSARLVSVESAEVLSVASYSSRRAATSANDVNPATLMAAQALANGMPDH